MPRGNQDWFFSDTKTLLITTILLRSTRDIALKSDGEKHPIVRGRSIIPWSGTSRDDNESWEVAPQAAFLMGRGPYQKIGQRVGVRLGVDVPKVPADRRDTAVAPTRDFLHAESAQQHPEDLELCSRERASVHVSWLTKRSVARLHSRCSVLSTLPRTIMFLQRGYASKNSESNRVRLVDVAPVSDANLYVLNVQLR